VNKKEKLEKWLKLLTDVSSFTIPEIEELSDRIGREVPELSRGDFSSFSEEEKKLLERLVVRLFNGKVLVYENYIERWDKAFFTPNDRELELLKHYQKNNFDKVVLPSYAHFKKLFPSLRNNYEKEEKISKERKKTLDKLLKNDEYRQKAEEALRRHGNSPTFSRDNNDVKKMTDLLNRVSELEEKLKKTPNSESDKQELSRLKAEIESLKSKQNQQNDKNPQSNDLPWGMISVIVIAILLLVIIFLYRKSKR